MRATCAFTTSFFSTNSSSLSVMRSYSALPCSNCLSSTVLSRSATPRISPGRKPGPSAPLSPSCRWSWGPSCICARVYGRSPAIFCVCLLAFRTFKSIIYNWALGDPEEGDYREKGARDRYVLRVFRLLIDLRSIKILFNQSFTQVVLYYIDSEWSRR